MLKAIKAMEKERQRRLLLKANKRGNANGIGVAEMRIWRHFGLNPDVLPVRIVLVS